MLLLFMYKNICLFLFLTLACKVKLFHSIKANKIKNEYMGDIPAFLKYYRQAAKYPFLQLFTTKCAVFKRFIFAPLVTAVFLIHCI